MFSTIKLLLDIVKALWEFKDKINVHWFFGVISVLSVGTGVYFGFWEKLSYKQDMVLITLTEMRGFNDSISKVMATKEDMKSLQAHVKSLSDTVVFLDKKQQTQNVLVGRKINYLAKKVSHTVEGQQRILDGMDEIQRNHEESIAPLLYNYNQSEVKKNNNYRSMSSLGLVEQ